MSKEASHPSSHISHACSLTIQRLNLSSCDISTNGMNALAQALAVCALPNLPFLDLSGNWLERQGMLPLVEAVNGRALPWLRELGWP